MFDRRAYLQAYYQKNKEKIKARSAQRRLCKPEETRALVVRWHAKNKERIRAYHRTLYERNPVAYKQRARESEERRRGTAEFQAVRKEQGRRWRATFPERNAEKAARYLAGKLRRVPRWLSSEHKWLLREAYALACLRTRKTGIAWQVDHIVPLRGVLVSGLHLPWNVQVIPARANAAKGNRLIT